LLVGLNNNSIAPRSITVDTGFGPNVALHDYTGHAGDIQTDGQGRASFTIPTNAGGFGYVCYSRAGISGAFPLNVQSVTQDYEGAADLDIKPAEDSSFLPVCRIWAAGGTAIQAALFFDTTSWTEATQLLLELDDPDGNAIASHSYAQTTPQGEAMVANAPRTGWHTFRLRAANPSSDEPRLPFRLRVNYQAPQEGIA
jgi:alpha-amylase